MLTEEPQGTEFVQIEDASGEFVAPRPWRGDSDKAWMPGGEFVAPDPCVGRF